MTGGRVGSRASRRAKMLPIRSIRTVQPASSHQRMKSRRAAPSRSLAASRHTPPFVVAPSCANSIRLAHRRSPLTCRFRIPASRLAKVFGSIRTRLYILRNGTLEERDVMAESGRLTACGIELEVVRCGAGHPILLLHGFQTVDREAPYLEFLGRHGEVIAPSSPGFGHSGRPKDFDTVYDLVHLYLELLDRLPGDKVTLLGLSFGGWLAAEVAAACSHRLHKLVLVDPPGIKISDRETRDILDIFNASPDEVRRRSWHDPERAAPDFNAMSDEAPVG